MTTPAPEVSERDERLLRPSTARLLSLAGLAAVAVLVGLDLKVEHHPHFGIDGSFAFAAWFGLAAAVAAILVAKALGVILKRPDTYYDH